MTDLELCLCGESPSEQGLCLMCKKPKSWKDRVEGLMEAKEEWDGMYATASQKHFDACQQIIEAEKVIDAARESCVCGARGESLDTHPHVAECKVGEALTAYDAMKKELSEKEERLLKELDEAIKIEGDGGDGQS